MPKGIHNGPRGAKKKQYDIGLVAEVRRLYHEEGMTQVEVAAALGTTQKVIFNLMRRHEIPRRNRARRDQRGANNPAWRGDQATYAALHYRVEAARGKPKECGRCGCTDEAMRYEWANLTGNYADVDDYERMCVFCHRQLDAGRRRELGRRTMVGVA